MDQQIEEESAAAERGRELISAARHLLNTDRVADERELVLTTVLEVLTDGPKSEAQIHRSVNDIWPGADISLEKVRASLQAGLLAVLVVKVSSLVGDDWTLTSASIAEHKATRLWYEDAMNRLAREVAARAADDIGQVPERQTHLWAEFLVASLLSGISSREESYGGGITRSFEGEVRPLGLDGAAILERIETLQSATGERDFLRGCVLAAIDETDPFGNEIVGYVATGCVLHAVAAGRNGASAREKLGGLAGRLVVVDTNVLLRFLGPSLSADPFRQTVRHALTAGMDVVVPVHVLDELREVVENLGNKYIPDLVTNLKAGISSRVFIQSVSVSSLAEFVAACEEGIYSGWPAYVDRVSKLESELGLMGISVREHQNIDRPRVSRAEAVLANEITQHGHVRKALAIARDAESIEMVWRARREHDPIKDGLWPGGWFLSTDLRVEPTYQVLEGADSPSFVLRPVQWATLLTEAASGADASVLVEAAASYLRQETMISIAVKYPPATVLALARGLFSDEFSETDERVAQLSLTGLIDLVGDGSTPSGEQVATQVLARRSERVAGAQNRQRDLLRRRTQDVDEQLSKSNERVKLEREARDAAEATSKADGDRIDSLLREREDMRTLSRRSTIRAVLITIAILSIGILAVAGLWWVAGAVFLSGVVFLGLAQDWVAEVKSNWTRLLLAFVPQVVAIGDLANSIWG